MIKSIIIDDEPRSVAVLQKLIGMYCPGISVAGEAMTIGEAAQAIRSLHPQLVFLDIQMPKGNAFDLLDQLKPVDFEIIFVTAFDDYAIRAFKYSAIGYLLKPVDIDDLRLVVQKAEQRIQEHNIDQRLEHLLSTMQNRDKLSRIALPVSDGLLFYEIEDIIYCRAEGGYTRFNFMEGKNLLVSGTLKEFEGQLPAESFCRVHNSHVVNINHVRKYHKGKGGYVEMSGGEIVEISFRKRDEFLNRLKNKGRSC